MIRNIITFGFLLILVYANHSSYRKNKTKKEKFIERPLQNFASGPAAATSAGGVWPLPQKLLYGKQNRTLRYNGIILNFRGIRFADCDILNFARKTYDRLRVPFLGDATLEAGEVWGILRGLETLSQLIFRQKNYYYIRTANVHDWPEYKVRGILLDTSRHYLSKNLILRQIDIMAQNKMNLLHWHIVDMESFPYVSKTYPILSKTVTIIYFLKVFKGAYTPRHTYTKSNIVEIVSYARLRGIRVMVEFDTPGIKFVTVIILGHMSSWAGVPGLLAECRNLTGDIQPSSMIDPSEEHNYIFLQKFFQEVVDLFPEKFIHLGGDETFYWIDNCWERNPKIVNFMKQEKISNVTMLENYYYNRLQGIVEQLHKNSTAVSNPRILFWQEVFEKNNPRTDAIVHIWKSANEAQRSRDLENITASGHEVLMSACWYLNYISYGADWINTYYCDPRDFNGTETQKARVLGGIATMWAEFVDGTNLEARLWPRASAVAERLWSSINNTRDALMAWPRLHEQRCRLISRGFRAEPINGAGDYCRTEWEE